MSELSFTEYFVYVRASFSVIIKNFFLLILFFWRQIFWSYPSNIHKHYVENDSNEKKSTERRKTRHCLVSNFIVYIKHVLKTKYDVIWHLIVKKKITVVCLYFVVMDFICLVFFLLINYHQYIIYGIKDKLIGFFLHLFFGMKKWFSLFSLNLIIKW